MIETVGPVALVNSQQLEAAVGIGSSRLDPTACSRYRLVANLRAAGLAGICSAFQSQPGCLVRVLQLAPWEAPPGSVPPQPSDPDLNAGEKAAAAAAAAVRAATPAGAVSTPRRWRS